MIKTNDTFSYKTIYTPEDVEVFANLTGDRNPVHLNQAYAKQTEFKRPIVHGVLVIAAFSKVFGTMWPGEDSMYISQNINFLKPVYVNEPYNIELVCTKVDRERCIGTIEGTLKDSNGEDIVSIVVRIRSNSQFSPILF